MCKNALSLLKNCKNRSALETLFPDALASGLGLCPQTLSLHRPPDPMASGG